MRPETAGALSGGRKLLAAHVLGQSDLERSLTLPEGYCNHQVIRQFCTSAVILKSATFTQEKYTEGLYKLKLIT